MSYWQYMKSAIRVIVSLSILFAPGLAFAQYYGGPYRQTIDTSYSVGYLSTPGSYTGAGAGAGTGVAGVAGTVLFIIDSVLVPVLFAVAFIVFLYGVAQAYIFSKGDPAAVGKGHQLILWGVIGFVAMVSLWGLVNVVSNTFGLGGVGAPELPTSY